MPRILQETIQILLSFITQGSMSSGHAELATSHSLKVRQLLIHAKTDAIKTAEIVLPAVIVAWLDPHWASLATSDVFDG